MKVIEVFVNQSATAKRVPNLLGFIDRHRLASQTQSIMLVGSHGDAVASIPPPFQKVAPNDQAETVLAAGFLSRDRAQNQAVLRNAAIPKLFVGSQPLPHQISHVCVPFEGRRVRAPWLRRVLAEAARLQWPVRLCYCDRALVPAGIMRLADWLHVTSVKNALSQWLSEEVHATLHDWIEEFPQTEVHSAIGRPRAVLADEDPTTTLIMSSFEAGFHLPLGHRGAYYGGLLIKTGFTGYFIP